MKKIEKVELPFFWGFYNSPLLDIGNAIESEMEYYENECNEKYDYDDFTFDYNRYTKEIVNCFTNAFKNYLPSWVEKIENPDLYSPGFYNFQTDKIFVTVTLKKDWKTKIKRFVNRNYEWLKERVQKDWTSRSGFFSFIANDLDSFMEHVYALDSRYVSIILSYVVEVKNKTVDMYEEMTNLTLEEFCKNFTDTDFVSLNKEKKLKENNENGKKSTADNI